jgi:acyl phosphate:glycerol-3-phosphate acyltransferase
LIALIIGYLIGSIPTAYIIGKLAKGIDIRKVGGGNMGALNTAREIHPAAGLLVLFLDAAKGAVVILIVRQIYVGDYWLYAAGLLAVAGHCWPVFLKFKGGKGAATAIGVMLALVPLPAAYALIPMVLVIIITSNVTLGMTAGFVLLPLLIWLILHDMGLVIFALIMALFLGLRYIPTAKRGISKAGNWQDYIIEKNYMPWQSKRKKK